MYRNDINYIIYMFGKRPIISINVLNIIFFSAKICDINHIFGNRTHNLSLFTFTRLCPYPTTGFNNKLIAKHLIF